MGFDLTSLSDQRFGTPNGWRVVSVSDVAVVNELSIQSDYQHRTIEYIDIASVERGVIKSTQELSLIDAPSRAKRIVRDNDTLISTVRPNLEHYTFVKKPKPNTIASTGFAVVTAKSVDSRYLYYYLTTKPFTAYLSQIADSHTSAYPAINPDVIETAALLLPPSDEQRAIAHILGTLDDKIEMNHHMNQTLEAMVQVLFKNWCEDFEPFHDLGMQDSPLGEVPEGWRAGIVDNIAVLHRESVNPSDYPNELFDHYSIPAFDEERMPKTETGDEIRSNKFRIPNGAVLISKLNPQFPRVWLTLDSGPQHSVCSTEFLVVTPKDNCRREFLYSLFRSEHFLAIFSTLVTGTSSSHQRVRPEDLMAIDVIIPSEEVVASFSDKVRPSLTLVNCNLAQSSILARIRDTLLPKLLSGEMRIRDAEKFVERAI